MLTTPKMSETGTKATSTSHQPLLHQKHYLPKFEPAPVQKLTKKTQTLYLLNTLKNNVLIQHCTVLYTSTNI